MKAWNQPIENYSLLHMIWIMPLMWVFMLWGILSIINS